MTAARRAALWLLLGAAPVRAQVPTDSAPPPVIRGVIIDRQDIFEPDEARASSLARFGNAIHSTTRRRVIQRELLFAPGQPFDSARVAETARNLRALGIFRRVLIDSIHTDSGTVLRVTTKDGWSTRPQLDFSSTGGQTAWSVGIQELNLLGNAAFAALSYAHTPDRNALTLSFYQPRAVANRVYVTAGYQYRTDGRSFTAGVGQPFFSYASRAALTVGAIDFDGDVLRFFDGNPVAGQVLRRRYDLVRADGAVALAASSRSFVRLGLLAQVRRDDFLDTSLVASLPFPHFVTGAAGPYIWLNRASFLVVHNFRSFAREEDVDLSPVLFVGTYATPSAFGYDHDGLGLQSNVGAGIRTPGGFVAVGASASGRVTSAGLDSGTVVVTGRWLAQMSRLHSLVVLGQLGWQKNPVPGNEFDLGLGQGPRAFYAHAFTGDRLVNLLVEYRWTMLEDLWDALGVGLAGFLDHGGAWYSGSPRRSGTDVGWGLRLGPSRGTDIDAVISIDIARRFRTDVQAAGWAVVVRRGVRF